MYTKFTQLFSPPLHKSIAIIDTNYYGINTQYLDIWHKQLEKSNPTCIEGFPGSLDLGASALAVEKVSSMMKGSLQPTEFLAMILKL